MTRLRQIDSTLSVIQSRLNHLRRERDELDASLRRKRKPETLENLLASIARIDLQIKAAEKEEWSADNERYDLIWHRPRK
jgi:seryl-tRNA synthetase